MEIEAYLIIRLVLALLIAIIIGVYLADYLRFRKLYRLYRKELVMRQRMAGLSRLNPFMPKPESKKYLNTQKLLASAGIYINVEYYFTIKLFICIIGTLFFIGIQLTNISFFIKDIVENPNYGKTAVDEYAEVSGKTRAYEKMVYGDVSRLVDVKKLKENTVDDKAMLIEYISNFITVEGFDKAESAKVLAERMYQKLLKVDAEKNNGAYIVYILLVLLVLYNLPDIIVRLKIKLIEDKKDWEMLNCTYVYSIFGRLPPYNIRTILSNMLIVVEVFRPLISELLEALRNGKGEKAFDEVLCRTENQDLFEMLETMKLSIVTGVLNTVDMIDEAADNQLKWLEIKGIKRRKAKQLFAMIPVVIVMLLAAVYFSYSLSVLSNPNNFIR